MKNRVFIASLMVLLSVALFSCGGGGVGGGAEVFKTVTLTAESSVNIFDSDVAKHSADCGKGDVETFFADDVDVAFTSTINPGLPTDITGSAVRLESVTVKYKLVSTNPTPIVTPVLPDQEYALSAIVPANSSSLTVPIRIASQDMKSSAPLSDLISVNKPPTTTGCKSSGTYSYFVTLEFKGVEIDTNKEGTFETNLTVNFSDFVD